MLQHNHCLRLHSNVSQDFKKSENFPKLDNSTLFSCKEFGESGDSDEFDDFGEPSDSGESDESGDFGDSGDQQH